MRVAYGVDSGRRLVRIKKRPPDTVEYRLAVERWEYTVDVFRLLRGKDGMTSARTAVQVQKKKLQWQSSKISASSKEEKADYGDGGFVDGNGASSGGDLGCKVFFF